MQTISHKGFYFSGKIKDLLKELHNLSKEYHTLREVVLKKRQ
ncbi:hypothetical protein [Sporomusa termitida]|nr:hypothetical protein [Sporomusa termitida]